MARVMVMVLSFRSGVDVGLCMCSDVGWFFS